MAHRERAKPVGVADLVAGWLDGDVAEGVLVDALRAGGFATSDARLLTEVLVTSGERLDLSALGPFTVDKHSTGGVGDGTTLLVVPLLAAAGATVVKLSGRGLGHTGGTIDKLESIPGLRTDLEPADLLAVARTVGCAVGGQTDRMVPGDRALYALRHATGTAADPALIASSVMAKKLAAGASAIVLDVKVGEGALLPAHDDAVALARLCVAIGTDAGRRCAALVTAMDEPLGAAVGNALEVHEAITLLGAPPAGRLAQVASELAAQGLALARGERTLEAARRDIHAHWVAGGAIERLRAMVSAQGGDPRVCDDPRGVLPRAPHVVEVTAAGAGWVEAVPARAVGVLVAGLGAGRGGEHESVDPAVGIRLSVSVGDRVQAGDLLGVVHARTRSSAAAAAARLQELVAVTDRRVTAPPMILDRVPA